jgi:hypothetical protein
VRDIDKNFGFFIIIAEKDVMHVILLQDTNNYSIILPYEEMSSEQRDSLRANVGHCLDLDTASDLTGALAVIRDILQADTDGPLPHGARVELLDAAHNRPGEVIKFFVCFSVM